MNSQFMRMLEQIAKQHGVSIFEVKAEMEKAIDEAWNNGKPNAEFSKTFPNGKPTIEEFIATLVNKIKDKF